MPASGSGRYTIGQVMIAIAVLAGLLAAPRLVVSPDRVVMACVVGLLTVLFALHVGVETVVGRVCPACGKWALRRLLRHRHYHRCAACRGRFKRFRLGPWLDASGPEDAARYLKPGGAGTWLGFARPKVLSRTASGALLQSKRTRDVNELLKRAGGIADSPRIAADTARKVSEALAHLDALRNKST